MPDEHDQKFATRNGDVTPTGESEHASRTPPKGVDKEFADFNQWKSGRETNRAERMFNAPVNKEQKTGKDDAESVKTDQDATEKIADGVDDSKTDGDTGKSPKSDSKQDDSNRLPDWMKKRLDRANKRAAAMEKRNSELQQQVQNLMQNPDARAKSDADAKAEGQSDNTQDNKENTENSSVYDFDYPDEDDYLNAKGELDDDAYLLDVKNWHDEKPLVGGKHAKTASQQKNQTQQKQPSQQDQANAAGERFRLALESLEAAFDGAESAPDGLFDDFVEQGKRGAARFSYEMLDWMADNEEEAIILAQEFVERPRKASNIYRKPVSQQSKLLADLAKSLKNKGTKKDDVPLDDEAETKNVGTIDDLRTRRKRDPNDSFTKNAGTEKYSDYANARAHSDRSGRSSIANAF